MKGGTEELASLIEALASETSKEEDYVVETEPLRVPNGDALDDTNSTDNRETSEVIDTFKHDSFINIWA